MLVSKNLIRRAVLPLLFVGVAFQTAFADRRERLIDAWQPVHFDVAVTFNDTLSGLTSARADVLITVRKKDVTMVDFDFGDMPVSAVTVDGERAQFAQHDSKLDVYFPKEMAVWSRPVISISYSGKPKDGLILVKDKDGLPSAIGDNWPDRVHNWIPCFDHPSAKASVKFTVTAPTRNAVVANGVLESKKENNDATTTWIWNEPSPVSPYNMVVAAGQFATAEIGPKNSAVPVTYYVAKSEQKYAEHGFSSAYPTLVTFGQLIEWYPYGKLALIVGATRFGGMENANTIVFTPNLLSNFDAAKPRSQRYNIPAGVERVVAHEIAHQWFGDAVTESTWADLWLSEGFATYFAGLFLEKNEGPEAFKAYMRSNATTYFNYEKRRRAPIYDTQTEKLMDLLNPNNYEKGGWVLHELRGMLGDKAFFDGLKIYYQSKRSGTASSEDLRAALEKASGQNLKNFFDRWIYGAGHPIYTASWSDAGSGSIEIKLIQSQPDDAFLIPVTVAVVTAKGTQRVTIKPESREATLKVKSAKPTKLIVDPDEMILKEVTQ